MIKNKIIVNTFNSKYEILIGINLINKLNKILNSKKINSKKILIVFDSKIPSKIINNLKMRLR